MKKILIIYVFIFAMMLSRASADVIKSTISIHAGVNAFQPGYTVPIALRIEVPENWYTYAEDPGDAGMPPNITLNAPEGVEIGAWRFPPHETFSDSVGTYYGFKEEVVLLNEITIPVDVPDDVHFKGIFHVVWMICKDICLPFQDRVTLTLPMASDGEAVVEVDDWDALLEAGGWADGEENAERAAD